METITFAGALSITSRHAQRLKARFRAGGARALVHGGRGQSSPRRLPAAVRTEILRLMTTQYTLASMTPT